MNGTVSRLLLLGFILLLILAPFAGLAPLLLVLFVATLLYSAMLIGQALFTGQESDEA